MKAGLRKAASLLNGSLQVTSDLLEKTELVTLEWSEDTE